MSPAPIIQTLHAVNPEQATSPQQEILTRAKKQVGFIPNMYANMANAPAVLDTYLHGYGLFRSESGLAAADQEVVFLAISKVNRCDYCTAAHSMIADKVSGVPKDVLRAIRAGEPLQDLRLAALYDMTTEMVTSRGRPVSASVDAFLKAGFAEQDLLYIVLAIAVKTLSNYSNHLFGTEVDRQFSAYAVE